MITATAGTTSWAAVTPADTVIGVAGLAMKDIRQPSGWRPSAWCKTTAGVGSFEEQPTQEGDPHPMSVRVSPTERIRAQIDELFASERDLALTLEARLSARLLMQTALEAGVDEFLGRARYQRHEMGGERTVPMSPLALISMSALSSSTSQ